MPWRGPEYLGDVPSLGWLVGEWIEAHCVIPDGDDIGLPYRLTDEMWLFLARHYQLVPDATEQRWQDAWTYRRSQLVRPQKWGKGPFSAAMICAESVGPVRFAGWDANGEPFGRSWPTPIIQVTAASEAQTRNVYTVLLPMIERGPLADWITDTGNTRINLPGGGWIEPVTSSARSRLGARITFAVQDETHSWLQSNGGVELADNQRRNLSGTGGRAIETTNAWNPSEGSVAQRTAEARATDIYRDHRMPARPSITNKIERRKAMRFAYGDSAGRGGWVSIDRTDAEAVELAERDPGQALRFFMNIPDAGSSTWVNGESWDRLAEPREMPDGTAVVLALDGSDVDDWTVIRAETEDGYQFTPTYGSDNTPTIWNPADYGGQVPRLEVAAAVEALMGRYAVPRMYCDPPYWETEIDAWSARWGERVVIRWETYRTVQMHAAAERLLTDVSKVDTGLRHDGCPVTAAHMRNVRRTIRPGNRYVLRKAAVPQKIDAAVAAVIVHEAASDTTAGGLWRGRKQLTRATGQVRGW